MGHDSAFHARYCRTQLARGKKSQTFDSLLEKKPLSYNETIIKFWYKWVRGSWQKSHHCLCEKLPSHWYVYICITCALLVNSTINYTLYKCWLVYINDNNLPLNKKVQYLYVNNQVQARNVHSNHFLKHIIHGFHCSLIREIKCHKPWKKKF